MKTFTNWLSFFKAKENPVVVNTEIFKSFADMYHGTDDCDIAGLWETKILKTKTK